MSVDFLGSELGYEFGPQFHPVTALTAVSRASLEGVSRAGTTLPSAAQRFGALEDLLGNGVDGDLALGFAKFGGQMLLGGDERLAAFVGEGQGQRRKNLLGNLLGGALEHHDFAAVLPDVNNIQIAFELLEVEWDWRQIGR